ncbi:ABC transporter ATP-binding protein [Phyllobacterium chamaecytisi]|uniref:ABC transporter ATP-binding protein n=1 Tax=Phyllobacterium chamaecytisi TaxID=2876082 RepID=UPI001CCA5BB7|nr:sn-glycerol-3-phosphate ABC transporter ATP-binding protein UgpC [Phyllobacterium sp. KW56]MBZ9603140.1 sn-glycerol-3-phosphate ABC transporter ATP-binding protein UgpC [Phyllobacterium sp. KW56]
MVNLSIRNLVKQFGQYQALNGINIEIDHGELVVLVGPSGCGKSTLLRIISGLEGFDGGELLFDGAQVVTKPPKERGIALVFQSYALYPHMTVFQNMAFGLSNSRFSKADIRSRVSKVARSLALEGLLDRLPKQLSGGQRQRVAIGRAIVREPKVFLFDEPLSNLDAALRSQMRLEIAKLHQQLSTTMVYVTHDQAEAMTLADKIVVMNKGSVEQIGRPLDLYKKPVNLFVATFLGSPRMNILEGVVSELRPDGVTLDFAGISKLVPISGEAVKQGDRVLVGLRPEDVTVGEGVGISAKVEIVEEMGDHHLTYLSSISGQSIVVKGAGTSPNVVGDTLSAVLDPSRCHYFDSRTELALPVLS